MAVTAREVIMVFRGQNYLSSAIRRVGSDVGKLSSAQTVARQKQQLQIAQQRAMLTRSNAEAERKSIESGSRRLTMDKAVQAQAVAAERSNARLLQQQTELRRMRRVVRAQGALPGQTPYESSQFIKAQKMQVDATKQAILNQATAVRKLAADEDNAAHRVSHLTQFEDIQTEAIKAQELQLERLSLMEDKALSVQRWQGYARTVEHAGRVTQMFGIITGAAMGYAADQAAKFNTQVTLAATQDITPGKNSVQQIKQISGALSDGILKLMASGKAVASSSEFSTSGYSILSGVTGLKGNSMQKAKEAISLIKEFNLVTKANFGLVSLDQITQAGITLLNTFGTSVRNLPHEFDVMQNAVNRGRITMGQFTDGLNQTAPAAKAAGYTFDQMAGTLSFLSTKFPNYNRAAIGYARLVEILANQKFIAGLKAVGVTITDTTGKHLLPFEQVITRLVKKFPDLAKGGLFVQNFFKQFSGQTGFIGARRAFTVAVQDQPGLDRFSRNIPAQAAGLVNASATALSKTGEVKLKELKTQFQALIITLGQGAIPAFVSLAKPVEAIINWFNGLGTSTKHAIGYFITMSAILGVLVGSLAIVGGSIASMVSTFMLWRLASQAAALGTAELSTEVGILGDTVGAVEVELAPLLAGLALLALLGKALATAAPTVVGHTRGTSGLSSTNIVTSNGVRYIQQPGGGRLTRAPRGAITTQEAASAHAINQAVADSPRYQHAIGANQKAVNAFTKALQMEAAAQRISNAIDRETGVTGSLKVRSVQGWIALIEKAKTAAAKNPFDIQAQKRMEGAEALLNAQFKNQPVLLAAINDVLGAYNDQVQQATDSTKTLGTTFQDVLQGVMSMYNTFLGQEQSAMGELFSGPFVNTPRVQNRLQWGGMLTGKDLLKDEMASLSRFHAFHAQLNQLRGKGAPAELIKELMAKGPDGVMRTDAFGRQRKSLIQELIGLSPADRKKYFDGIRAQTKATQNAALADLKDQLKIYRQHGRNIAIAIVAGLRDENVAMTNAITGMIKNMFPGLPVGNTGAGGKPGHKAPPHIPHPAASGKTGDQHTHYHVTVPGKDASIKTQLKHAHFVNKNRYTNRGKGQFPGTR